jgi:hypothetical protein
MMLLLPVMYASVIDGIFVVCDASAAHRQQNVEYTLVRDKSLRTQERPQLLK